MLELAEMLSEVLQKAVPSLNEQQVEEVDLHGEERDVFARRSRASLMRCRS
jgi:dsDNA-binding SOS-regulon protein